MKIERSGPNSYLLTNTLEIDATVIHGGDSPQSAELHPGETFEFATPFEVRLGPFRSTADAAPRRTHYGKTLEQDEMFGAIRRGHRALLKTGHGQDVSLLDFNAAIIAVMSAMAGLPDPDAPKLRVVAKEPPGSED